MTSWHTTQQEHHRALANEYHLLSTQITDTTDPTPTFVLQHAADTHTAMNAVWAIANQGNQNSANRFYEILENTLPALPACLPPGAGGARQVLERNRRAWVVALQEHHVQLPFTPSTHIPNTALRLESWRIKTLKGRTVPDWVDAALNYAHVPGSVEHTRHQIFSYLLTTAYNTGDLNLVTAQARWLLIQHHAGTPHTAESLTKASTEVLGETEMVRLKQFLTHPV